MSIVKAISILRYRDPQAAVSWLAAAFGLEAAFIARDGDLIVHAQLRAGSSLIFIGPDRDDDRYGMHSPERLNGTNQCVYLVIAGDVDGHAMRAGRAGAELVTAPYDTDYGGREYSCRDLEGHIWSIGTYAGEADVSSDQPIAD